MLRCTHRPSTFLALPTQLTVITHAADIADIITSAVNDHEAAAGSVFNAVSGRAVTFDGLVRLCAKAAGMEPKIVHYDPAAVGVDAKKAFPFRNTVQWHYQPPQEHKRTANAPLS